MFEVTWDRSPGAAFDQLQSIFDARPDLLDELREVLRDASRFLAHVPERLGADEGENVRCYPIGPVVLRYHVSVHSLEVVVFDVTLRD